jgi:hypothetical protein
MIAGAAAHVDYLAGNGMRRAACAIVARYEHLTTDR